MKHILIKQEQSLKNGYNEHLASKWSSGHTMQLRATQNSIACPTHIQCKTLKNLHQRYEIQQGHKFVVLKIMQHNLKILQSKDTKHKVLNINWSFILEYFKALKESNVNIQKL